MADLRVGIIGLGRMGWLHAEHIAGAVRGASLALAAVDPEHKRRLDADGTAPCPVVDDAYALINSPEVDAVIVVSPTNAHKDHIVAAAEAGKPVFTEKPVAGSVEDAFAVAQVVRRTGIPFQIGFQRRFDPGYVRAKELIASGAIGEVEMFRGLTCDGIPPVDYLRTSGGLFWDLGIHDFDAARFLMDDEIESVFATGAIKIEPRLAEFDDVDHGIVTLKFRNGALGVIQNAWRAPYGYDIRAEVHGSLGKVVTDFDAREPAALYTNRSFSFRRHHLFVERFEEAYRLELQAWIDAIQTGQTPSPGIDDAVVSVLISDAATQSRRDNSWIDVPVV